MKVIRALILMLLIISNINGKYDFSMDNFINYTQENGAYDLLQGMKLCFGSDIAISLCEDFFPNTGKICATYVKVNLANGGSRKLEDFEFEEVDWDGEPTIVEEGEISIEEEDILDIFTSIEVAVEEEENYREEDLDKIGTLLDIFKAHVSTFKNILKDSDNIKRVTRKIIKQITK